MAEFTFPVEVGSVVAFAEAIGDVTGGRGDVTGLSGLAPLTYGVVADRFDPEFPRRPRPPAPWPESLPPTRFHVEQTFEYRRHVQIGEILLVRRGPGRTWERQGRRGGRLRFVEELTEYFDTSGGEVMRVSWVDVETEKGHGELTAAQRAEAPPTATPAPEGIAHPVATGISPTQVVMYVGVTGDFHPLHHDQAYAKSKGYPTIFLPGMLTMALTGRAVTDTVDQATIERFTGRWRGQVWPGDSLTTYVDVGDTLTASTCNQHGAVVFQATVGLRAGGTR